MHIHTALPSSPHQGCWLLLHREAKSKSNVPEIHFSTKQEKPFTLHVVVMATHLTVTFTNAFSYCLFLCYKSRQSEYFENQKDKYLLRFCGRLCICGTEKKWNKENLLKEELFAILNPPLCSTSHTTDKLFWF